MLDSLTNLSPTIIGLLTSLVGAAGAVLVAIIQMRIAWRKEIQARAEHKPISRKSRRGPVLAVFVLLLASAIGGFAFSQYLVSEKRRSEAALEVEMRSRIDQLSVSAQRLENIRVTGKDELVQLLRIEEAVRRGKEGVVTNIGVDKCVVAASDTEEARPCTEQQAQHVQLCAELPITATLSSVDIFARTDDVVRGWSDSKVVAGSDFGGGRFDEKSSEQIVDNSVKKICQGLSYWNGDVGIQARLVVRYVPAIEMDINVVDSFTAPAQ